MNIERRKFLTGACGLVATASLPAVAEGRVGANPFPGRGPHERLTIAYAHVEVGATKPFSVFHISDTHLTAAYPHEEIFRLGKATARGNLFGGHQEESLRDSLAWAKQNSDYVLHTGDLIDWQSEANFDLVKKYYGETVFGSMGNHEFYTYLLDEKHTWREPFKERSWKILKEKYPVDARFSAKVVNGVNFICMDDVFGTVQPDQVERFHAETKKGLPMVLAIHVPILTPELWRFTRRYWSQCNTKYVSAALPDPSDDLKRQLEDPTTRDFIAYLKTETLLKCILAGHQHLMAEEQFSPTARQYIVGANYLFCGREVLFT